MVMTSDGTRIQSLANWPMSHAKRVTRDKRKSPEYLLSVSFFSAVIDKMVTVYKDPDDVDLFVKGEGSILENQEGKGSLGFKLPGFTHCSHSRFSFVVSLICLVVFLLCFVFIFQADTIFFV